MAGTVVAIGEGTVAPVQGVHIGDRVTAIPYNVYCGRCRQCRAGRPNRCLERLSFGSGMDGAMTRFVSIPLGNLFVIPDGLSMEAAALSEPLGCALRAVADEGAVGPADDVLVSGPGPIGLLCAMVASLAGARVLLLGRSADEARLRLAASLPQTEAVAVDGVDVERLVMERTRGEGADVVFECAGVGASAQTCLKAVARGGRYVQVGLFAGPVMWELGQVAVKELRVSGPFGCLYDTFPRALSLLQAHTDLIQQVITSVRPLADWRLAFEGAAAGREAKVLLRP
jgi:L-iditol 2-dehydrogenase